RGRQNPWVGGTRPPDTSFRELSLRASFSEVEIWDALFWAASLPLSRDSASGFEFVSCLFVMFNLHFKSCGAQWRHFLNIQGLRKPASRRRPLVHAPWGESYRWIDLRAI